MNARPEGNSSEGPDPIVDLLRAARPEAPDDLAARVIAGLRGEAGEKRLFWREAEVAARRALVASAAGALLAGGLAWSLAPAPSGAPGAVAANTPAAHAQPAKAPEASTHEAEVESELASLDPEQTALSQQGFWLLTEGE